MKEMINFRCIDKMVGATGDKVVREKLEISVLFFTSLKFDTQIEIIKCRDTCLWDNVAVSIILSFVRDSCGQ